MARSLLPVVCAGERDRFLLTLALVELEMLQARLLEIYRVG